MYPGLTCKGVELRYKAGGRNCGNKNLPAHFFRFNLLPGLGFLSGCLLFCLAGMRASGKVLNRNDENVVPYYVPVLGGMCG